MSRGGGGGVDDAGDDDDCHGSNNIDDNYLPDTVKKCLDILDESVEILTDLERDLNDGREDRLTSDMQLHDLYDMAEDISESSKLKRAESNFMRRQTEESM